MKIDLEFIVNALAIPFFQLPTADKESLANGWKDTCRGRRVMREEIKSTATPS